MRQLPREARAQILTLLCEGMSIRAITRITGASKNTVTKLLIDAGRAAAAYQDRVFRNLTCQRIQLDEIWSFVYAKNDNVKRAKSAPVDAGDVWTWTAIDADTKLLITWLVGARDTDAAMHFVSDLRERLANRVQITSDGHRPYLTAVDSVFGDDVDYAMLQKIYGSEPKGEKRYSPAICLGAKKRPLIGNPDKKHISTSFAERQNLTMRMHMRRFTRLTNAFSKKVENHTAAVALHSLFYNFVRVHQTLKVTPAMAAGVTARLWEMTDVVEMIEAWESKERRDAKATFEVVAWKVGGGYYVRAIIPNKAPVQIDGFKTEGEAAAWIRQESVVWLNQRSSR